MQGQKVIQSLYLGALYSVNLLGAYMLRVLIEVAMTRQVCCELPPPMIEAQEKSPALENIISLVLRGGLCVEGEMYRRKASGVGWVQGRAGCVSRHGEPGTRPHAKHSRRCRPTQHLANICGNDP